jgi:hypothetical protein
LTRNDWQNVSSNIKESGGFPGAIQILSDADRRAIPAGTLVVRVEDLVDAARQLGGFGPRSAMDIA